MQTITNIQATINTSTTSGLCALYECGATTYTAHEHLPEFSLVNMNARVYDPQIGRFLSPDNYVQALDFSQSFNRYSYCLNNPLKYTDPSGEQFYPNINWSLINNKIANAVNITTSIATVKIVTAITPFAYGLAVTSLPLGMYCANYALNTFINIYVPPIIIPISDEISLVFYPSISPSGIVVNGALNIKSDHVDMTLGINTNGDNFQSLTVHFENGFNFGWYRTNFSGEMSQGVGGYRIGGKNWSFRLDEDHRYFVGDGDDRYRTGGFELTVGNFVMSGRVITNDLPKEADDPENLKPFYTTPNGKTIISPWGVYKDGKVLDSQLSVGYKTKYGVTNFEHHSNIYQHYLQNGIHKYWGTPYFQSEYFDYHNLGIYRFNPYSIYYY